MANDAEELDGRLAERLRKAADHDPASAVRLPDAAQSRVLDAMRRESARLVSQRRRRTWAASAVVAVAAGLGLALYPWPTREPKTSTQVAQTGVDGCGLPTTADQLRIVASEGRQRISLGRFGELAAEADADLRIVASGPCELTIGLGRGMLAADLHNLRPARLRVSTELGDVEVRGTTFSVRVDRQDRSLEVVLLHGAVDVVSEQRTDHLTPGHTLRRQKRVAAARIEPSSDPAKLAVQALIASVPPAAAAAATESAPSGDTLVQVKSADGGAQEGATKPAPVRSATELLARAERERRAGQLDTARALYREAGALRGADAEVALLRWARLELSAHAPTAARDVLARYRQHFARGRLAAEASWLELRTLEELGQTAEAKAVARKLIASFPDSPHAQAAQRVLSAP